MEMKSKHYLQASIAMLAPLVVPETARAELQFKSQAIPINAHSYQQFGKVVAMEGTIVAVASPLEEGASQGIGSNPNYFRQDDSGAVYIYEIIDQKLVFKKYIKSSNSEINDTFGSTMAMSGNTLVVAAQLEDGGGPIAVGATPNNAAPESGAVYVFQRNGDVWTQEAYLKASNTNTSQLFGSSVAISGNTIVVGARGEDSNATGINGQQNNNLALNSGAAYVFVKTNGTWVQQAYLKASNTEANDFFGASVSIAGDLIAVGAYNEDGNGTSQSDNSKVDSGAVYIFIRYPNQWSQQAYIKASNIDAGDNFGSTVAITNDTLFVGAPFEASGATGIGGNQGDNSAPSSGAVYAFKRIGTSWIQDHYIKPKTSGPVSFGKSLTLNGDVAAISSSIYYRNNGTWSLQELITSNQVEGGVGSTFGISAAISGEFVVFGEDGRNTAKTGSPNVLSGAALLFGGIDPTQAPEIEILLDGNQLQSLNNNIEITSTTGVRSERTIEFKNVGNGNLTVSSLDFSGNGAANLSIATTSVLPLILGRNQSSSIKVSFLPTALGVKDAILTITNTDFDENPYRVTLNSISLSRSNDGDGDGLNDYAESLLSPLGFDWRVRQDALVQTLSVGILEATSNLNSLGFYSKDQLAGLYVNNPIIEKESASGKFNVRISFEISTDLINWAQTPINSVNFQILPSGHGRLSIDIPEKAFIRLKAGN